MNKPPQNHEPPKPFYPCAYFACAEAGTLPAGMLYWSDKRQGWYCADCFDHEDEERGVSLEKWLEDQLQPIPVRLANAVSGLMRIVEGAESKRWSFEGVRLKDTHAWCELYCAWSEYKAHNTKKGEGDIKSLKQSLADLVSMWDEFNNGPDAGTYMGAYYAFYKGRYAEWERAKALLASINGKGEGDE